MLIEYEDTLFTPKHIISQTQKHYLHRHGDKSVDAKACLSPALAVLLGFVPEGHPVGHQITPGHQYEGQLACHICTACVLANEMVRLRLSHLNHKLKVKQDTLSFVQQRTQAQCKWRDLGSPNLC